MCLAVCVCWNRWISPCVRFVWQPYLLFIVLHFLWFSCHNTNPNKKRSLAKHEKPQSRLGLGLELELELGNKQAHPSHWFDWFELRQLRRAWTVDGGRNVEMRDSRQRGEGRQRKGEAEREGKQTRTSTPPKLFAKFTKKNENKIKQAGRQVGLATSGRPSRCSL